MGTATSAVTAVTAATATATRRGTHRAPNPGGFELTPTPGTPGMRPWGGSDGAQRGDTALVAGTRPRGDLGAHTTRGWDTASGAAGLWGDVWHGGVPMAPRGGHTAPRGGHSTAGDTAPTGDTELCPGDTAMAPVGDAQHLGGPGCGREPHPFAPGRWVPRGGPGPPSAPRPWGGCPAGPPPFPAASTQFRPLTCWALPGTPGEHPWGEICRSLRP